MADAEERPAAKSGLHVPKLRFPRFRTVLVAVLAVVLLLWIVPTLLEAISSGDGLEGADRPYLLIFAFVIFDAIIPIFPSESAFVASGYMEFESIEAFQAAFGPNAEAIMGDVPNYTDITPVIQVAAVLE